MKLVAYHDVITNASDIKNKFAEVNRDQYPDAVYEYILQTHIDTETPVIDVIAWCCDLTFTGRDDEYYPDVCRNAIIIHEGDDGIWHLTY